MMIFLHVILLVHPQFYCTAIKLTVKGGNCIIRGEADTSAARFPRSFLFGRKSRGNIAVRHKRLNNNHLKGIINEYGSEMNEWSAKSKIRERNGNTTSFRTFKDLLRIIVGGDWGTWHGEGNYGNLWQLNRQKDFEERQLWIWGCRVLSANRGNI